MGKKPLIILGFILLVLGLVVWMRFTHVNEPYYKGRSLSSWIARLPGPNNNRGIMWAPLDPSSQAPSKLEAVEAVRNIGTNAIPYLMEEMQAKDGMHEQLSGAWDWTRRTWQRIFSNRRPGSSINGSWRSEKSSGELRHWDAARGFHALGPLAKSAIPQLTNYLQNGISASPDAAAYALSAMGPEGLAAMMPSLTNTNVLGGDWAQLCVIWALAQAPETGRKALPELLALLGHKDATIRMAAGWALGQMHSSPELIAPALATHLSDTGFNMRSMTEEALKEYGIEKVTLPSLKEYLNDSRLHVRMAATNAILAIYPEDAASLGVK